MRASLIPYSDSMEVKSKYTCCNSSSGGVRTTLGMARLISMLKSGVIDSFWSRLFELKIRFLMQSKDCLRQMMIFSMQRLRKKFNTSLQLMTNGSSSFLSIDESLESAGSAAFAIFQRISNEKSCLSFQVLKLLLLKLHKYLKKLEYF